MDFKINNGFAASCALRPISAFSVPELLEVDPQTMRAYISSATKQLWFHQFCAENGIRGKIVTDFLSSENLAPIPYTGAEGGTAFPVKEFWKATIYLGDEAISSAISSQVYMVHDQQERDSASNQLRNAAIGAALSQAGFGVVSSFDLDPEDAQRIQEQMGNQGMSGNTELPFNMPTVTPPVVSPAAPTVAPNSFFGNATNTPAPAAPVQAPVFQQPAATMQAPVDPLAAAKQVKWVGKGKYQGLTLGEVLSDVSGVKNIQWIVNQFTARTPEQAAVKEAAKVILESLNN